MTGEEGIEGLPSDGFKGHPEDHAPHIGSVTSGQSPTPGPRVLTEKNLERAISHALNYHSIDAKANEPDWRLAELMTPEVMKWLRCETDVQIIEAMSPEERAQIGLQP